MPDESTQRLHLHAIDVAEGERILARTPDATDSWADDFPSQGDCRAVGAFVRASTSHGDQRPFGFYRITRADDAVTIGGIGFKGQPVDGRVEIGYGIVPSARGHGYAAEAVTALVALAGENGVSLLLADTDLDNVASQMTLVHAGFSRMRTDEALHFYELELPDASG
ncbi:GNAT family N-acetyltransferase [Knoellia pratensis]